MFTSICLQEKNSNHTRVDTFIAFLLNSILDVNNFEVLEYSSHDKFLKYECQVDNGKPQGRGNMSFKDGGFYFGEWQDGARHGKGRQKYSAYSVLLLGSLWLSNHWSFKVNQLIRMIT